MLQHYLMGETLMRIFRTVPLLAMMLSICAYGQQSSSSSAAGNPGLSRAEFVATISNYFNWVHWSEYNDYAKAMPRQFSDVTFSNRYVKQIECALEENIIGPDENNKFYPDKPMTRQDAAVAYVKAFKIPESATNAIAGYTDAVSVSAEAKSSVNALVAAGGHAQIRDHLLPPLCQPDLPDSRSDNLLYVH
jgi:hypothetical protein